MQKRLFIIFLFAGLLSAPVLVSQNKVIPVFDGVVFYDIYAPVMDSLLERGGIRHSNSLVAKKLTEGQLALFGDSITMRVVIHAACDNYDRIGSVNIAFVPKGSQTYCPDSVKRIEAGRYITPFMNRNIAPDSVEYLFRVDNLKHIFTDKHLAAQYDFWMEFSQSGVPYAAQKQVEGCEGRTDVFVADMSFITSCPAAKESRHNFLLPLFMKQRFNNYEEKATDAIGKTVKTIEINTDKNLSDAQLVLITSNHGANKGGEEYIRRKHFVYFDGTQVLEYTPGRTSCEPFRQYNTQRNGIYSPQSKTDDEWQSFSNWCPGDVIDTRIIKLGKLKKGAHAFRIEVPDAAFAGKDGNFPLSLYLQGKYKGYL